MKQNIPTSETSKCFTLIQKNVKTEHVDISEHDCFNSRKQFFSKFFCSSLFCSGEQKQKFTISHILLRITYHREDQHCLYTCTHEHPHLHTHTRYTCCLSPFQSAFTTRIDVPWPEDALQPQEISSTWLHPVQACYAVTDKQWLFTEQLKNRVLRMSSPLLLQSSYTNQSSSPSQGRYKFWSNLFQTYKVECQ